MLAALDDAVGNIVDTLKTSGLYNNSVTVFTSDVSVGLVTVTEALGQCLTLPSILIHLRLRCTSNCSWNQTFMKLYAIFLFSFLARFVVEFCCQNKMIYFSLFVPTVTLQFCTVIVQSANVSGKLLCNCKSTLLLFIYKIHKPKKGLVLNSDI